MERKRVPWAAVLPGFGRDQSPVLQREHWNPLCHRSCECLKAVIHLFVPPVSAGEVMSLLSLRNVVRVNWN